MIRIFAGTEALVLCWRIYGAIWRINGCVKPLQAIQLSHYVTAGLYGYSACYIGGAWESMGPHLMRLTALTIQGCTYDVLRAVIMATGKQKITD